MKNLQTKPSDKPRFIFNFLCFLLLTYSLLLFVMELAVGVGMTVGVAIYQETRPDRCVVCKKKKTGKMLCGFCHEKVCIEHRGCPEGRTECYICRDKRKRQEREKKEREKKEREKKQLAITSSKSNSGSISSSTHVRKCKSCSVVVTQSRAKKLTDQGRSISCFSCVHTKKKCLVCLKNSTVVCSCGRPACFSHNVEGVCTVCLKMTCISCEKKLSRRRIKMVNIEKVPRVCGRCIKDGGESSVSY